MTHAKVLLVDEDESIRSNLGRILGLHGFEVSTASNASDALQLIASEIFDVLLSDLHMKGSEDELTVLSAIRHSNPKAVTLQLSAFPQMTAAANAILLHTDEIPVKPVNVVALLDLIEQRLVIGTSPVRLLESVPVILTRTTQAIIDLWYSKVLTDPKLTIIPLTYEQRCGHLPKIFVDLDLPPEISTNRNWSSLVIDLHRETEPKSVGDFRLRGSVCAGLTGRFVVSVAQVSASSNRVDAVSFFLMIAVAVRGESGKRAAFSKAVSPPSFPPLHAAANSAGVRSASAECGR